MTEISPQITMALCPQFYTLVVNILQTDQNFSNASGYMGWPSLLISLCAQSPLAEWIATKPTLSGQQLCDQVPTTLLTDTINQSWTNLSSMLVPIPPIVLPEALSVSPVSDASHDN